MEIEEEELKEDESKNGEEKERHREEKTDAAKEEIDKTDQPVETFKIKEQKVEPEKKKKITTPIKFESSSSKLEKKIATKNETTFKSEPLANMIEIDPSKPVGKLYYFRRNKIK